MNLLFDFYADKATKTIHITREFAASLDLVWDAFTKPEILNLWLAPKPYRSFTKEMDLRDGGRWLHAMISPDNVMRWSLSSFIKVDPKNSFSSRNTFCDEDGNPISNASSLTTNYFEAGVGKTTVRIEKIFEDLAVLEMMTTNGFKEGSEEGMRNLDQYFLSLETAK